MKFIVITFAIFLASFVFANSSFNEVRKVLYDSMALADRADYLERLPKLL